MANTDHPKNTSERDYLLRASVGNPGPKATNRVAAFQAEMEDILVQRLDHVDGGAECPYVSFALGALEASKISAIKSFIQNPVNRNYFESRYNIRNLSIVPRLT